MRVVVPALSRDCVASAVLRAEQVEHEVRVLDHDLSYGQLVAELWRDGESFIVVEDDIAPYPGALKGLEACGHYWCGFYYPLPGRWDFEDDASPEAMMGTDGYFKVTADVMQAAPELYRRWESHEWRYVDVALTAALRHVFGLEGGPVEHTFHVHTPPVAHAMHYRPEASHERVQEQHPPEVEVHHC